MARDRGHKNVWRAEGLGTRLGGIGGGRGGRGRGRRLRAHVIEHSKHPPVLQGGGHMAKEVSISSEAPPKGRRKVQHHLQID